MTSCSLSLFSPHRLRHPCAVPRSSPRLPVSPRLSFPPRIRGRRHRALGLREGGVRADDPLLRSKTTARRRPYRRCRRTPNLEAAIENPNRKRFRSKRRSSTNSGERETDASVKDPTLRESVLRRESTRREFARRQSTRATGNVPKPATPTKTTSLPAAAAAATATAVDVSSAFRAAAEGTCITRGPWRTSASDSGRSP